MATPERDTVYSNDGTNRTIYTRESSATGWFVGIIVALALLAIGYLVFSANSGPATTVDVNNTPAVTTPMVEPAVPAPTMDSPAMSTSPAVEAPAPATETPAPAAPVETAPATPAPAETAPAAPAGQ